ncbi:MAG: DUF1501 domain-containing protein [Planctomycetia bacterium]
MCNRHDRTHLPRQASRRDVIRLALASLGMAALGPSVLRRLPVAHAAPQSITRLVLVNLVGGNDGLNTVIPRTLSEYYTRRPTIRVPAGQELALTGGANPTSLYGLHPSLTRLRSLWLEGSAAVVQRVGYPSWNQSHFESSDIYSYGVRNGFGTLAVPQGGWIGRWCDQYAPTPLGAVALRAGRPTDFAGASTGLFTANDLASFLYNADPAYPEDQAHRLGVVQQVLDSHATPGLSQDAREALGLGQQLADQLQAALAAYTTGVTWPTSTLASSLRDAAVMIQGGFETRIFYVQTGGFDLHGAQGAATGSHATLLASLDAALGAFVQDMKDRNLWNTTRIVVHSEFGRRAYENGSNGTDHGHGNAWFVLGGGIQGGSHGPDLASADLQGEFPGYAVDFRDVWRDMLANHLGSGDLTQVFPESQPTSTALGIA